MSSDEEILAQRRSTDSFDAADFMLRVVSWGLWGLAAAWFFIFTSLAPVVGSKLHHVALEPEVSLICAGLFCSNLSKSSPRATWSAWRRTWQLVWVGALGILGVTFLAAGESRALAWLLAAACGCLAAGMAMAQPFGTPRSNRVSSVVLGRMLLLTNGLLATVLLCGGTLLGVAGLWSEPLGPPALGAAVVPLTMCSVAAMLCQTDTELVAALPPVLLVHVISFFATLFKEGAFAAVPPLLVVVLHCLLYLPFPWSNPDANPFHMSLRKIIRSFARMMSQPSSGFGDE